MPVGLIAALALSHWTPLGPVQLGMCINIVDGDAATISREFDLLAAMKVTWVRADFDWSGIEGERGRFDWAYADRVVHEASLRRMNVVAILDYTPDWARAPGTTSHSPPQRFSDYAEFAHAAATRYASLGVRTWEIWNEPNSGDFWQPRPDPDAYGELFRAAAGAVRAADPGATLLTGGLTRGTDATDGERLSQRTFLERLYANGAARLADAVAIHPYSFPWLPMAEPRGFTGGFNDLPKLRDLMVRHGDSGKKIWITEFGAATGRDSAALSPGEQAESIVAARRQVRQWDWAGPLIYYELRDEGTDPHDIEQNFGVVRNDFTPKPAAKALME
ncbi:cellulase family glycosylhydrolase [Mycobacterium sp. Marseille-P9652]|uniref:cellulase family glycosylhydrolase n=1 Tax=Mycobacterium sp. Marseille-P9652 TaxID=2654950 RepID=UPI0018D06015|nr:cellulase family glycosylhydrolase [Mycobacterium sp. Marseille-P9652]